MKNYCILLIVLFAGCKKVTINQEDYQSFKIKKHYTLNRINTNYNSNSLKGKFILTTSCEYILDSNYDQINKVIGFGQNRHHINSMRIGWNWSIDHYNLYAYWYDNKERKQKLVNTCISNEICTFNIEKQSNGYLFELKDSSLFINSQTDYEVKRLLLPYFGGIESFPGSLGGNKKCEILIKIQ